MLYVVQPAVVAVSVRRADNTSGLSNRGSVIVLYSRVMLGRVAHEYSTSLLFCAAVLGHNDVLICRLWRHSRGNLSGVILFSVNHVGGHFALRVSGTILVDSPSLFGVLGGARLTMANLH